MHIFPVQCTMTQGYKDVSVHITASKHMHKVAALNSGMELRLNKQVTSVYGHQIPELTGPDKWGLSHWPWQSPEERLEGLCCRIHTDHIREHISPASPGTVEHLQAPAGARQKPWAPTEKAQHSARCILTHTGAACTWNWMVTLKCQQCCPILQSLPFQGWTWLTSSPVKQASRYFQQLQS